MTPRSSLDPAPARRRPGLPAESAEAGEERVIRLVSALALALLFAFWVSLAVRAVSGPSEPTLVAAG